ncbi:MAG TPA: hypothetical protein ENJ87_07685 [Gammaproteobacteria bacterium]|nr:hypothetical protein [Gammaproteobacteria bacterium]
MTNTYRTLIAYLSIGLFAALIAGCGGGSGDQTGATDPLTPIEENFISIEAVPGPITAVRVGEQVVINDTSSFAASTQALSYSWAFTHIPDGSNAVLQGATTASPSFIADVRGVYMLELQVSAEGITSQRAVTSVVVTNPGERLTGPFNHPGLSSNCTNCHNGETLRSDGSLLPYKSPNHIASSNTCQTCHTPQGFKILPYVDHQEVFGNCSECHNGSLAIGKSSVHIQTNAECDNCHTTASFLDIALDGSFDHAGVGKVCVGCHNGKVAKGKTPSLSDTPPGTHPDTNAECGYCHTTASFLNAYPDHTSPAVVGQRCDSCHGAGPAKGPTVGHPVTTNVDCVTCHSIVTFSLGGVFNHRLVEASVQSCESCHNDNNSINARGKGVAVPTHIVTDKDCGTCHNTETFVGAGIDHSDPAVLAARCDSCHGVTATGKPLTTPFYEHMPTVQDCKDCHTPGTFTTGTYDHAGVTNNCNACHNNKISVGKLPNHIPTTPDNRDCADCHNTTTFVGATFDHAGIVDNCSSCHNGVISKGKSVNHVQTGQDCVSCHDGAGNNFATFAGTFIHNQAIVGNNCASCHNTGIATPKNAGHIPAQAECSQCHVDQNIGGFTSSTFVGSVHPGIVGGCDGCHNGVFSTTSNNLYGKSGTHLPTAQDCDTCHTKSTFSAPTNFVHAGISGNCESCHDGNYISPAGAFGKVSDPTPPHPATTLDCGACHGIGANFKDGVFDHSGIVNNCASCHGDNATGALIKKNAGHIPTTQDCSICHVPGTFKPAVFDHTGIIDNCASCHGDNSTAAVTKKNAGHVSTTQDCSLCHNTTEFAGAGFDHRGIVNNCASCHDGATARGKTPPPNHVPTNDDCSLCHQTTGFVPATFDHIGIVDNCQSCHDGKFAKGKSTNHVLTNQDCGICHTTSSFVGAGFNHTGIVDNCDSCHGAGIAIGKDAKTNPPHIATTLDCYLCHTTATFVGGTWTHDATSAGRCDQCHNNTGGGATPKNQGHLSTTVQCDVCHSTNGWAPASFSHDPQGDYPGDHRNDPGCSGCHGNSISSTFVWPSPTYAPFCAACHESSFERKSDHIGGKNGTVWQNRNCATSGCHRITDRKFDD